MKKNKKGFTLAELLIVVAIIAVLVAISIPIFTAQLKKARLATNKANARSALSAAMAEFIDARYDTATGKCTYRGVDTTSPHGEPNYKSFANIGYKPRNNGLGISDVSKWDENTTSQVKGEKDEYGAVGVLTDRVYRYWDVAMQGDGTFLTIVCIL